MFCIFITAIFVSYFFLIVGEFVPKRIARTYPVETLFITVRTVRFLLLLCRPLTLLVSFSSDSINKLLRVTPDFEEDTEEEIRMMMDDEGASIDENEIEMINNVFEFDDKTAGDIATHRMDLTALPVDAENSEIVGLLSNSRHSRIPVYEDSIDNIIGILYIRDLVGYILNENCLKNVDLRTILRKPNFVPVSKKTDELFEQMQKNKVHMSVVIDEYGGTMGIVTMEDLVEEIMGNILDEYDTEEMPIIEELDGNTFVVGGGASLDEIEEFFDIKLPVDEYDTMSGFIISLLGRIPEPGEKPEMEWGGFLFKVYELDEKRIKSLIMCRLS